MNAESFSDMTLCRLDETDTADVQKLINEHYIPNWPFLKAAHFDIRIVRKVFYQAIAEDIKGNTSLGFRLKRNGELIACIITSVQTKQTSSKPEKNPPMPRYSRFKSWCLQNIYSRLNTDRYLYIGKVTVHPEYIRHGVSKKIGLACVDVARSIGCNYIAGVAVNAYVARVLNSIGCKVLREIRLNEYVEKDTGLKPFTIENPPHTHAVVCYKSLSAFRL